MADDRSKDVKRRRARSRREETPPIETVGGELRVWRDRGTNKIVIEAQALEPDKKLDGLISLSGRHARHLENSLLLFAAETESSPAFTAVKSPIQIAQDVEGESVDSKGFDKVSLLGIRPHGSKCEANQSRATVRA
jgi:hypothetical protein